MVDRQFADPGLAQLYDVFHPWDERDDLAFYLPLVMTADAVLDVGCGTGALLHMARAAGHAGRLCGLDPGAGMLERARERSDIEWVLGDLASVEWDQEYDLVVMTGHAFQVLVDDDQLRRAVGAIRAALAHGGRFAFETRNPPARAWETWAPEHAVEVVDKSGSVVRMEHHVETPMDGDIVRFTTTFSSASWDRPEMSSSALRFLGLDALVSLLRDADFVIEEQFGDWTREPLAESSPEIITITRRP